MLRKAWGQSAACLLALISVPPAAVWAGFSTPWVENHGARVRLLAGAAAQQKAPSRKLAGVEIRMAPGWKTYWRMPGDAGGVPPHFDWGGSTNLETARVLYPAPYRLKDAAGDSVGYSGTVVFPVEVTPRDPSRPIGLRLAIAYGICREICVPAEARLELSLPPDAASVPAEIVEALGSVPRPDGERRPSDPRLKEARLELSGTAPRLIVEAAFPAGSDGADLFIEAPDGLFVALPVKAAERGELVRFEVDLSQGSDPEELKGKLLRLTLVSQKGQSETRWLVE